MKTCSSPIADRWSARAAIVAQAADLALACEGDAVAAVSAQALSSLLSHRVLSHLVGDLVLAQGAGALLEQLHAERLEVAGLIEGLDRLLLDQDRWRRSRASRGQLARTLRRLIQALGQHRETDRRLWEALEANRASPEQRSALLDRVDAAQRGAAAELRFLWHPPVAYTEATGLRDNPRARRVLVLDELTAAVIADDLDIPPRQ